MVAPTLTPELIEAGAELLRKLDEQGLAPRSAFWLLDSEHGRWDLVFADPDVDVTDPLEIYRRLGEAMDAMEGKARAVSVMDISVRPVRWPPVAGLRQVRLKGHDLSGTRLTNTMVGGTFIEDAYVYRVA